MTTLAEAPCLFMAQIGVDDNAAEMLRELGDTAVIVFVDLSVTGEQQYVDLFGPTARPADQILTCLQSVGSGDPWLGAGQILAARDGLGAAFRAGSASVYRIDLLIPRTT